VIVQGIYQGDEPTRLRLQLQIQLRHIPDDDCMEILSELDVIACAQRSITNLTEGRVKHLTAGAFKGNVAAEVSKGLRSNCVVLLTAEDFEDGVDGLFGFWIGFAGKLKKLN
jgi:hypothetical protein